MPLLTSPKAASAVSNTPSRVIERSQVNPGQPTASTARANALKARLSGQTPAQPVAPRPAGSSARAEQISKLQKFNAPAPKQPAPQSFQSKAARFAGKAEELANIEPPPSGITGQAPAPEPVRPPIDAETATPPAEATSEVPLSPQLDVLARKERQLRKAQQEFKAAQDAWKQEQAGYISRDALTSDPLKVLAEAGITADKLVELQINQAGQSAPKDPNQLLQDKIAALEARLTELTDPEKGELAKRDQQAYDAALNQIEADVRLLVDSNPAYGTIKAEGKASDVKDLIVAVFEDEGQILDVEEACQLVEDRLVQNLLKDYERISRLEKIKAKIGKPSETAEADPVQQPSPVAQATQQAPKQTTLTNSGSTSRPMSARDRAVLAVQARLDAMKKK